MKKILKNVLLFSALIGSVNCLALPAAAVDVATASTSVMADAADVGVFRHLRCRGGQHHMDVQRERIHNDVFWYWQHGKILC